MFYPEMDVIKYFLFLIFLAPLPGKAQLNPGRLQIPLPDTILTIENTLYLIEENSSVYFSYNPELLKSDLLMEWDSGVYFLQEILLKISDMQGIGYTIIDKQVVFYDEESESTVTQALPDKTDVRQIRQIKGRILGEKGEEPLSYATVWSASTWRGTICNSEGIFVLNLSLEYISDSVSISCMGYKTKSIPLSEFQDSINTIRLQAAIIPIQEVVIRRNDPIRLLREALVRIHENYSQDAVMETAFYREIIQKNNEYISVSEAVIEVYKPGVESLANEQVKVIRGRKNNAFTRSDTISVKMKAGLETSFLLDLVRNRPDFLQEELFYMYEFHMSDIVLIQDRSTYAIDFKQRESSPPPHFRGRIYLDLESLAFREIEFEADPQTINHADNSMVLKKPRNLNVRPLSAKYFVRYQSEGNTFYLSMIRSENEFRFRQQNKLFGNNYQIVTEMAVTGLETRNVQRFRVRETANPRNIFAEMLGGYDPSFWGPYNYLIPEESLEQSLRRISDLLKNNLSE